MKEFINYRVTQDICHQKWSSFVCNHPKGNIFQTPEMFEVYKGTKKCNPIALGVVDYKYDIVGILLAVIQKEHNGIFGIFSSRAIITGGPIVENDNQEILSLLLSSYNEVIKHRVIYSQIRNIFDTSSSVHQFIKLAYNYEPHLDIINDLSIDKDLLWNKISPKARNKIRKAEKNGLEFRVIDSTENISKQSYNILKDVYTRAKLPLADKSLFSSTFNILRTKQYIKVFGAFLDDNLIAIRIGLVYKDMIYDWYAGTYTKYIKCNANDFLPYYILIWGAENGYKTFDFGGAGKPNVPYGVRDHKLKFGGTLVEYGRFIRVNNKFIYWVGKTAIQLRKKLL